jgi:acetyltransferase-like isoleucine patch superfamily enzyme
MIGSQSTFGDYTSLCSSGAIIRIGNDNMFSHYIKLRVGQHKLFDVDTNIDRTNRRAIVTHDHVWVGMGAALMPSCEIGEGSVVGMSSVVTGQIPPHATCAGNPARVLHDNIRWER